MIVCIFHLCYKWKTNIRVPPMIDYKITKANYLVEASYMLSLQSQKLVLACLAKVDSRSDIPKNMDLTALEFSQIMGIDISNAHRELYKAIDHLYDQTITVKDPDKTEEFRWIQRKAKYHKGEGRITFVWSDDVLKYIGQLKNRFTSYKLRYIAGLKSPYSVRLYELLMQFNATKDRVIYLVDFRSMFKLQNKYMQFRDLNKFVIKPSVNELNQRSDLVITYETIKQGRKVVALSFGFKCKDSNNLSLQ